MSAVPGTPPALSLTGRLSSNLVRGPLFFFFTGFFGCISLAASCVEEDGRMQHSIARTWARASMRAAGAPVTVKMPYMQPGNYIIMRDTAEAHGLLADEVFQVQEGS